MKQNLTIRTLLAAMIIVAATTGCERKKRPAKPPAASTGTGANAANAGTGNQTTTTDNKGTTATNTSGNQAAVVAKISQDDFQKIVAPANDSYAALVKMLGLSDDQAKNLVTTDDKGQLGFDTETMRAKYTDMIGADGADKDQIAASLKAALVDLGQKAAAAAQALTGKTVDGQANEAENALGADKSMVTAVSDALEELKDILPQ